jgi:hypothetical protein
VFTLYDTWCWDRLLLRVVGHTGEHVLLQQHIAVCRDCILQNRAKSEIAMHDT